MRLDDSEATGGGSGSQFITRLAETAIEVQEAQRLRFRVFAGEQGAQLPDPELGLDRDHFDPFCEHLVVRDVRSQAVVGTYRILDGERALRAGGFYSESEFDLSRLHALPGRLVEVGRACVDPECRRGAVLSLLLAGLATHIHARGYDFVIGCASVPFGPDPRVAAGICERVLRDHLSPPEWRVFPHRPFVLASGEEPTEVPLPPLLKGYLRMGAYVCGEPARDDAFQTADLFVMLPMARMSRRYAERFLKAA